jgi:hypothetical protein
MSNKFIKEEKENLISATIRRKHRTENKDDISKTWDTNKSMDAGKLCLEMTFRKE